MYDSHADSSSPSIQLQLQQLRAEGAVLPAAFLVPEAGRTPAKDQGQRGTNWIFSTLAALEASYRKAGLERGFLGKSQYLSFSEQACEVACPGLEEAVKTNPIWYEVRGVEAAYTISSIKRLLYEKQVGLVWSAGPREVLFEIPIVNCPAGGCACEPCAHSSIGCCSLLARSGWNKQGIYLGHKTPRAVVGHGALVVGWNDELRVQMGVTGTTSNYVQGGFILKNSAGSAMGHSAGYWASQTSLANENTICPSELTLSSWVPADKNCMQAKRDPIACALGLKKLVRGKWVKGATVLRCTLDPSSDQLGWSGCKSDRSYVVSMRQSLRHNTLEFDVTIPEHGDGLVQFHLVEWDPLNSVTRVNEVTTGPMPWWGLEVLLTPVSIMGNHPQCGYFFYPYETFMQATTNYPANGIDPPMVMHYDVEWKDSSFIYGSRSHWPDYQLLNRSLNTFSEVVFDGPLDRHAKVD
eukprot:m51a1_g12838 hypothetical protein (466) ;mRNA; r:183-2501